MAKHSRKNGRLKIRLGFFLLLGAALVFLSQTGWFAAMRPWQDVAGWAAIPSLERPIPISQISMTADAPRIQWLGHSGFLLQWHGKVILFDPNLSDHCTVIHREALNLVSDLNAFSPDLALISHAHYDHFDLPTLRDTERLKTVAGPPVLGEYLGDVTANGTRFRPLKPLDSIMLGRLRITAVRAEHGGQRRHPFHGNSIALGYMVSDGLKTVYFAGDTGRALNFKALGEVFSPDIAILPIGAFQPYWLLQPHHLSPEDAVAAAGQLGAKVVIPCHFGTFRMAFDPLDRALPRFAKAAEAANLAWYVPGWEFANNRRPGKQRSTVIHADFVD